MPLTISDLSPSVTFVDTTVSATPQPLDADVTLTGGVGGFDGGSLVVSGVLPEDVVAIRSVGTGPGEIDVIGGNVTFGGVIIGTVAGGDGSDLSVSFNDGASAFVVDALIQNLTFSNTAGAPTLSRELTISVSQSPTNAPDFTNVTGTAENPAGFSDGFGTPLAKPAFIDLDGDGLIDAVFGSSLMYAGINDGSGGANFITGGADDPFAAIGITNDLTPAFVDLDGDGVEELVTGAANGGFRTLKKNDSGDFVEQTGTDNPFGAFSVASNSAPTFADVDGDGDLDMVSGKADSAGPDILSTFRNNDDGTFTELTGADNPFGSLDVGGAGAGLLPALADLDKDGDLDLVVGGFSDLKTFRNNGDGNFTELTGADNPFNELNSPDGIVDPLANNAALQFVDLDGDGDLDAVVDGSNPDDFFFTFLNDETVEQEITVTIADTIAPAAPMVEGVTIDTLRGSDGITSDTTLVFSGTAEAGATVTVFLGGNPLGNVTANSNGAWSFDHTGTVLADGTYSVTAEARDGSGNLSDPSDAFNVTVDTVAPGLPNLTAITDDTGASSSDRITSDGRFTLTGTGEVGEQVLVDILDSSGTSLFQVGVTVDASGNWTAPSGLSDEGPLADGVYTVELTQSDIAGNSSGAASGLPVTVDATAPAAPVVSGITTDTGSSATDGVTSDTTLVVNGTAEAGTTVEVFLGGASLGTATADDAGAWTFDHRETVLADGAYTVTAVATDLAGNSSGTSTPFGVTIDTAVPTAPVLTGIATDTGSSATDGVTSDTTLVVNGTAEAGATVELFLDATSLGSATADGSGAWSFDHSSTELPDGAYAITAKATNLAGATSDVATALDVTVDTVAPDLGAIDLIGSPPSAEGAPVTTPDPSPTISFAAEVGATIEVDFGDGTGFQTIAAGTDELQQATLGTPYATDGAKTVQVRATDLAGNTSVQILELTVDRSGDDSPEPSPLAGDDGGAGFATDDATAFTTRNVLANDSGREGETLSIISVDTDGTQGLVSDNRDGTFRYDPDGAFDAVGLGNTAVDSFLYTVSDGEGGTDTATVSISVAGTKQVIRAPSDGAGGFLRGSNDDETIIGNARDNVLVGFGGKDRLTGLEGRDTFVLKETRNAELNVTITDFEDGDVLAVDDQLLGFGSRRTNVRDLTPERFIDLRDSGLVDYDRRSGELRVDTDGDGDRDLVATLEGGVRLGLDDVLIF